MVGGQKKKTNLVNVVCERPQLCCLTILFAVFFSFLKALIIFFINFRTLSVEENKPAKRVSSKSFVRVSKFKHLKGDVMLKGKFENLKNLSKSVPAESNLIEG